MASWHRGKQAQASCFFHEDKWKKKSMWEGTVEPKQTRLRDNVNVWIRGVVSQIHGVIPELLRVPWNHPGAWDSLWPSSCLHQHLLVGNKGRRDLSRASSPAPRSTRTLGCFEPLSFRCLLFPAPTNPWNQAGDEPSPRLQETPLPHPATPHLGCDWEPSRGRGSSRLDPSSPSPATLGPSRPPATAAEPPPPAGPAGAHGAAHRQLQPLPPRSRDPSRRTLYDGCAWRVTAGGLWRSSGLRDYASRRESAKRWRQRVPCARVLMSRRATVADNPSLCPPSHTLTLSSCAPPHKHTHTLPTPQDAHSLPAHTHNPYPPQ